MTSAALVWAPARTTVSPPPPQGPHLVAGDRGPDVASYQGYPNWDMVKAGGCRFAFTKATESVNYTNPYFERNWSEIKRVGLVRGVYHFARPEDGPPEPQVDYFLSHVPLAGDDMLVLDMESGPGNLKDWTIRFLRRCSDHTGKLALLYTGAWFMNDHGLNDAEIQAESGGLWLASYSDSKPPVPPGWDEILFWQFTDKEQIPGIQGGCDCNIFRP